jgi:hypothetical protein
VVKTLELAQDSIEMEITITAGVPSALFGQLWVCPVCEQRELALSERPLVWLVERHAVLLQTPVILGENKCCGCICHVCREGRSETGRHTEACLYCAADRLENRMEAESIEDELIDREDTGQLEYSMRFENDLWQRTKQIIYRGSNR